MKFNETWDAIDIPGPGEVAYADRTKGKTVEIKYLMKSTIIVLKYKWIMNNE